MQRKRGNITRGGLKRQRRPHQSRRKEMVEQEKCWSRIGSWGGDRGRKAASARVERRRLDSDESVAGVGTHPGVTGYKVSGGKGKASTICWLSMSHTSSCLPKGSECSPQWGDWRPERGKERCTEGAEMFFPKGFCFLKFLLSESVIKSPLICNKSVKIPHLKTLPCLWQRS